MADDLGADFLKGYFGMAEQRQNALNRQDQAQQFAQQMQLRQQEFGLSQQRLAEEVKQHAIEGEWRDAQSKHQQMLENHQKFADDWSRTLKGFDLQASGAAAPVAQKDLKYSGPTTSIGGGPLGLPAMQVPTSNQYQTAQGQPAVNFGGGQFLRPTTPQERAQTQFDTQQQQEDIAMQGKAQRAATAVNDIATQFPDSEWADESMKAQLYGHLAYGAPIKDEDKFDALTTKETNNYLKNRFGKDPVKAAAAEKRWSTVLPIFDRIWRDKSPGAGLSVGEKTTELHQLSNDMAEVSDRAQTLLKPNATDADRNNAVNTAVVMLNRERKAAGKPALHPEAATKVMGTMTKGIPVQPKKTFSFDLSNIDPATGKPKVVVSRPPSQ